jgi:rubrerythrin
MKADDAKKIISTAIDKEVEAYTFYRGVADKAKNPAMKSLFSGSSTASFCRGCLQRISQ